MSLLGYINLASNAGDTFTNAADSDFMLFTQSNSQKILLGVGSNSVASLTISSNLAQFNGNIAINNALAIKGLQITANDGSTANVTQTAVTGFSNDNLGQSFYIGSNTSNNYFKFIASNTERARLTGDGKMGIGTSNPIAMLDVRSNVQVLGGSLSVGNGSFEFPPLALTGFLTNLSNASYGNGTYVSSSSTSNFGAVAPFFSYYAFDKTSNNDSLTWVTQGVYNTTTGAYAGVFTTSNDVSNYAGEWLQLQMPTPIMLSSVTIVPPVSTINRAPNGFAFFGSLDGTNWYQLGQRFNGVTFVSNTSQSFTINANQYYSYIRFVLNQTQPSGDGYGMISELRLFGSYQGLSTNVSLSNTMNLTVPGNMYCGNISAGNMGMFRNALINGDFRINQRRTTSTWPGVAGSTAAPIANTTYVADRWTVFKNGYGAGSSCSWSPSTLGVSDLPYAAAGIRNYIRAGRVNGDTNTGTINIVYGMESSDSYRFAGQVVTLSCYVRAGSAFSASGSYVNLQVAGGTTTDEGWQRGLGFSSGTTFPIVANIPISTAWTRVSATGTIAANSTQLGIVVSYTPVGTASSTNDYIDVTGIQLERGPMATPFEFRPQGIELQLCQRYYETTGMYVSGPAGNANNTYFYPDISFKVNKRANPTMTILGLTVWNGATNLGGSVSTTLGGYTTGFYFGVGPACTAMQFNWTASAEL